MQADNRCLTFILRGIEGRVEIKYTVNEDPARWGYGLLGLDSDIEVARGFPVMDARTRYPGEGYAGLLGWIQIVDYIVSRDSVSEETVWVAPDVAPQAREANTPYSIFGIEPVMFDAPAFDEENVDWNARTFLAYTPDCLMTPVVEPICGFCWGYVIEEGIVTPKALRPSVVDDWTQAQKVLRLRLPTWTFGGEKWNPPTFSD